MRPSAEIGKCAKPVPTPGSRRRPPLTVEWPFLLFCRGGVGGCTWRGSRATARTTPGNPAPVPTSSSLDWGMRAGGRTRSRQGSSARLSFKCFSTASSHRVTPASRPLRQTCVTSASRPLRQTCVTPASRPLRQTSRLSASLLL